MGRFHVVALCFVLLTVPACGTGSSGRGGSGTPAEDASEPADLPDTPDTSDVFDVTDAEADAGPEPDEGPVIEDVAPDAPQPLCPAESECPASEDPCVSALECDPETGACTVEVPMPADTPCEADDDVCTFDAWDGEGACTATGGVETCDAQKQGKPCWTWQCNKKTGCLQTAFLEGNSCDDGNACTGTDQCTDQGAKLCLGTPLDIDDQNACTDDKCLDGTVTHEPLTGTACPAGLCESGVCVEDQIDPPDKVCLTWSTQESAPEKIHFTPGVAYAFDGIHIFGGSPHKQHLVYDPAGGSWSTGTTISGKGASEGAAVHAGPAIYVMDSDLDGLIKAYDIGGKSWKNGAKRPTDFTRGPAMGADKGDVFVAGGGNGNLHASGETHRYDPDTDQWFVMSPMPTPRGFVAHTQVGALLYVIGGRNSGPNNGGADIKNEVSSYNLATDQWTPLASVPSKRNGAMAAAINGKIYVAGGFTGSKQTKVVEAYDIASNTWDECGEMAFAFSSGVAYALNDKMYLFGGGSGSNGVQIGVPD